MVVWSSRASRLLREGRKEKKEKRVEVFCDPVGELVCGGRCKE